MTLHRVARLENFGIQRLATPKQRLLEYKRRCKGLSKGLQARFWLAILEKDVEVAALLQLSDKHGRRRT